MPGKSKTPRKKPTKQELKDLDHEILFLEGLIRRDANYVEALQILGDDYTKRGRYAEGLKVDEMLCKLRPEDSLVRYNLACSYSLMEKIDQAIAALEIALNLGYHDFKWMAKDPDLENIRAHDDYKKIEAKMRLIRVKAR